jgi:hypothetical protein
MTFTQIPQRIEIAFWAAVIPIMKDSSIAGELITKVYTLIESIRQLKLWQQIAFLAIIGLMIGFLIGLMQAESW